MIYELEFQILAFLILTTAMALWAYSQGTFARIGELTAIEKKQPAVSEQRAVEQRVPEYRFAKAPVLLTPTAPLLDVAKRAVDTTAGEPAADLPLDPATQLSRVSRVLNEAIETAARAEHLHAAAHERLDSAHYALQNLLAELSAVMSVVATSAAGHSDTVELSSRRPIYVTALAA